MKKLFIGVMLLFSITAFASETIDINQAVNKALDNNGSAHLEVNGAVTPISFKAVPPTGKSWWIGTIKGYMEGSTAFSAEKFGNLPALTNGLMIKVNGVQVALIKSNRDLVLIMDIKDTPTALAKSDRSITGEWNLAKAFGKPILVNSNGVEIIVQDNLSTLVDFHVNIQGMER